MFQYSAKYPRDPLARIKGVCAPHIKGYDPARERRRPGRPALFRPRHEEHKKKRGHTKRRLSTYRLIAKVKPRHSLAPGLAVVLRRIQFRRYHNNTYQRATGCKVQSFKCSAMYRNFSICVNSPSAFMIVGVFSSTYLCPHHGQKCQ